jgi:hypothetical protein
MPIDEPELNREAAPKMSAACFRMSRSIRSCQLSRRSRATSAAKSDGDGDDACVVSRRDAPVSCIPNCVIHRRSTVSCSPSSLATAPTFSPLLATRSTASRLYPAYRERSLLREGPVGDAPSIAIPAASALEIDLDTLRADPCACACERAACTDCAARSYAASRWLPYLQARMGKWHAPRSGK